MKYKQKLALSTLCPLLQTYKKVSSLTTLGNLINEKVRHFQPEETSIPGAIQRTERTTS
jgi:hypothetical protein